MMVLSRYIAVSTRPRLPYPQRRCQPMRPWFWIERRWPSHCVVPPSLAITQNGCRARRDDHPRRGMSLQHLIVDRVAVIGAIGGHRTERALNLVQQIRQRRDIADIIRRQFDRG